MVLISEISIIHEIEGLVTWLRGKATEARARGLVVGVSGGIDSAVVAALIYQAFPEQSLALILPCHSSQEDVDDAHLVCEAIGICKQVINLDEPQQMILERVRAISGKIIPQEEVPQTQRLMDANLRARLRMSTLYAVANSLNYLVVGTDNAAEVYTGYFTKYGDGGVDLSPLSQFVKREIRVLAQALKIPEKIINKAPSAGLWLGQTDEGEMGVTYNEIDNFLEGKPVSETARQRIAYLHQISEHKRNLPPVYPRKRSTIKIK